MNDAVAPQLEQTQLLAQVTRSQALLRSASVLLARRVSLRAVWLLHREIQRVLDPPADELRSTEYRSAREAEEEHRRLSSQLSLRRVEKFRPATWQQLRRRAPIWASWVATLGVCGFLASRYAYAIWAKARWARENPGGSWISRYYPKTNFRGSPVLRYDVGIDHDWGKAAPAESMARDNWSATWDTCVRVLADVALPLKLSADDRAKLLVNDVVRMVVPRPGSKTESLQLPPGLYHIQIQFQEGRRGAKLRLEGIDFRGTDYYSFQRPFLEGEEARCTNSVQK